MMRLEVDLAIRRLIPHAILFNKYEEVRVATTLFFYFHTHCELNLNHYQLSLLLNHYDRPKRGDKKKDIHWLFAFYKHDFEGLEDDTIASGRIKQWIGFAIYISVLSYINDNPVQSRAILKKVRIFTYTRTKNYVWFWHDSRTQDIPKLLAENFDKDYLDELENELMERGEALSQALFKTSGSDNFIQRARQVSQINKVIEWAYYPERKRTRKRKKPENDNTKNKAEKKPDKKYKPKLKPWINDTAPSVEVISPIKPIYAKPFHKFYVSKTKDPISHNPAEIVSFFPTPHYKSNQIEIEELVDAYNETYFINRYNPPTKYRIEPLQNYDASVQQTYMACNDFELPSNIRYLSQVDCHLIFNYLVQHQPDPIASILLFSLMTSLPIETLLTPNTISQSPLFEYDDKNVFIVHRLGVSERKEHRTKCFENKTDLIRLPLPIDLFKRLLDLDIASISVADVDTYMKTMRDNLEIVLLTRTRIEKTLHLFIRRFTPTGNKHYADLICRIPVDVAPATYYSSHLNSEIISVYKQALQILNEYSTFDLSYFDKELIDFPTGSMQALTVDYVGEFINTLKTWVFQSENLSELFNRYSIYVWHCLFLTTGLRPNNGIPGAIKHIDEDTGWIVVDDKPNRSSTTERIVPLCPTAKEQINDYKYFLKLFRHQLLSNSQVSSDIHTILSSSNDEVLLNLIDSSYTFAKIKRGDIARESPMDLEIDPYWVRHFVRTQLEKLNTPLPLINAVIGHERRDQEGLNKFSSISKRQIHDVQHQFEKIAELIGIHSIRDDVNRYLSDLED